MNNLLVVMTPSTPVYIEHTIEHLDSQKESLTLVWNTTVMLRSEYIKQNQQHVS